VRELTEEELDIVSGSITRRQAWANTLPEYANTKAGTWQRMADNFEDRAEGHPDYGTTGGDHFNYSDGALGKGNYLFGTAFPTY
jgi:hypothetical protein